VSDDPEKPLPQRNANSVVDGRIDTAESPPRGETVRETINRSIREVEATMAKPSSPSVDVQALADKAVLGICEMLGLLFGLPFGEDLYRDRPFNEISAWHWFYLAVGIVFAGVGFMFPWIRTRTWIPERVSASLSRSALDARIWITGLLILFVWVVVWPDLVGRFSPSRPVISAGGSDKYLWEPLSQPEALELRIALRDVAKPKVKFVVICIERDCRDLALSLLSAFDVVGWDPDGVFHWDVSEPHRHCVLPTRRE